MPKKSKKQLNQEFLEKIKTINIGTGGKDGDQASIPCPGCGEPISEHDLALVAVGKVVRRRKPEKPENPEASFAA